MSIFLGRFRQELRERVTEVIQAGDRWNKTAQELIQSMKSLEGALATPELKKALQATNRNLKELSKQTTRLAKAFEDTTTSIKKAATLVE